MEDRPDPHGVINPEEARSHVEVLDEMMDMIREKVDANDMKDITETAIRRMKATLVNTLTMMEDTNVERVVKAMKDHSFKVLLPRSDETDQILEEIIPMEEIPQAADVI